MKRRRSKPRGEIGPIVIDPEGQSTGFTPVDLPDSKEEIEQFIVNLALKVEPMLGELLYGLVDEPRRTRESDFDFTLKTKSGNQYLELTEIAPLELTGGRYDGAPISYHQGKMADLVSSVIAKKAKKYGRGPGSPLHLLTYCTDWRFKLSKGVLTLVAHWAWKHPHCFASIINVVPSSKAGEVTVLFPLEPRAFSNFREEDLRNRLILRPDLNRLEARSDGSVVTPVSWPPWRGA